MRMERHNCRRIRMPEGIVFSLRLAGPLQRMLAHIIDSMVVIGLVMLVSIVFTLIAILFITIGSTLGIAQIFSAMGDAIIAVSIVATFILNFGYRIYTEYRWGGQTVGKRMFNLRVMDEQGLHLTFQQVFLRNLIRVVDAIPFFYCVGGASMMLSKYQQRLGDIAANTIVVYTPRQIPPDLSRILSDKYNSLNGQAHLAARLRQLVGPDEASLAARALARREELDPIARAQLFAEFAEYFRRLVKFPEETVWGMSDEKYVQNVVDVVYRDTKGEKLPTRPVETPSAIAKA